jgi:hypothetical protein
MVEKAKVASPGNPIGAVAMSIMDKPFVESMRDASEWVGEIGH